MQPDANLPYTFTSPLITDRLALRLMTDGDVDDIHAYQSREDVCRYLLFGPRSREEVAEKVAAHSVATTLAKTGDYWQLALELPATADQRARVIGDSYFTIHDAEQACGEIGWSMHPDFTGRGFAFEAATAVMDVAFRELGMHRVIAQLDPENVASVALCKRLGMREEAHFVRDLWLKGAWGDTGQLGILAEEWLRR
jgi:RimJ/RimL family protein N-acetyltransferase